MVRSRDAASCGCDCRPARSSTSRRPARRFTGANRRCPQEQFGRAWGASQGPLFTARRGFLPGHEGEWIEEVRHELDALYLRSLECYGEASLGLGGTELAAAERAGRELVRLAPYRERGHRLLVRALVRGGNEAEALRCYEALRQRLREELGVAPSAETRELHASLLGG